PAWSALGKRYYYDEEYGPGATGSMSRTDPTLRRALALDPNLEDAAAKIVSLDADAGKMPLAYQEAKAMIDKRPQSGFAHFTLSYVLRYAGLLHDAARECNEALRLDPGNYQFRSCASVFGTLGQFDQGPSLSAIGCGFGVVHECGSAYAVARRQNPGGFGVASSSAQQYLLPHSRSRGLLLKTPASRIRPTSGSGREGCACLQGS